MNENYIIIPAEFKGNYQVKLKTLRNWNGWKMNPDRINETILKIYTNRNAKLSRNEIDSLAKKEVITVCNNVHKK